MPALTIPNFGGGVIFAGSADAQQTNELQQCDGWDIGPRGQLQSAPTTSSYITVNDLQGSPQPQDPLYGLGIVRFGTEDPLALSVGYGKDAGGSPRYFFGQTAIDTGLSGTPAMQQVVAVAGFAPPTDSFPPFTITRTPLVQVVPFPYVDASGVQTRAAFINIGARYGDSHPREMPGLYVQVWNGTTYTFHPISDYDALGTGPDGEFPTGTQSVQLFPRGIAAYNNHLFLWGFDNADSTDGEGPSRMMFCNLGNPFKYGNDNVAAVGTDRKFKDTDAITIGSAGEAVTAGYASHGRLWIGSTRGLHYLSGYGRDSFLTDGTTGVAESLDVTGPYGLCEGPDSQLYGLSSRGLWCLNGGATVHLYRTLVAFDGSSNGYWDLLSGSNAVPGSSNLDLAWLRSDTLRQQVWVVIPRCNATTGAGLGSDTVVIKYHVETGGFTRQVFLGVTWLPGAQVLRGTGRSDRMLLPQGGANTIVQYGYGAPAVGPVTFGEYAPYGTEGTGTNRLAYLTLSWSSDALPITGTLAPSVDQRALDTVALTIGPTAPVSPANGDVWVDTSETDTNLGNGGSSSMVSASNVYLIKVWVASWTTWRVVSRSAGVQGTRITIPVAYDATRGTRVKFTWALSSGGDLQIEGVGMAPSTVRSAA